jgi:lipid A disaccharide synthetase
VEVHAVAGPELRAAGATMIVPQEELAVIGFSGVIAKLPVILRARRAILDDVAPLPAGRGPLGGLSGVQCSGSDPNSSGSA